MTPGLALLLTHGAGSGPDHRELLAVDAAVTALGIPVRRMAFPYRQAGRRAPDRAPVLLAAVREEAERFVAEVGVAPERLVLGGRSMGGRMCSMAVADGLPAAGLVLVSYPLHPPGRPDRLRTEHLSALKVPVLAVSGTRDPFGTPDELAAGLALVRGPVTTELVDGARHELKGHEASLGAVVARWVASLRPRPGAGRRTRP